MQSLCIYDHTQDPSAPKTLQTELSHLVELRVLAPTTESEWVQHPSLYPKRIDVYYASLIMSLDANNICC